ncbi:putative phosphoglycerate mutase pmu1 [Vermiconidia calcicola]|uniref:Phosphoglycerate mutase pmu1 n=1 Tax=Vermiconidia calcicola TaxID=1690605 RepID=A0ACC3MFZ9_9PEZI|nr:putative phosphoglycerate mutase pmu1 [Vermiconidia calcicola]
MDESGDEQSTQWQRFEKYVGHIVESSPDGTTYKVIYLGRHGEGYHNVGEAKYGTKAWDDYWSKLDGNGEIIWDDAHLTDRGKQQALDNSAFFNRQFAEAKMPAPERYYSSPLFRCLQTAYATWSGLEVPADRPLRLIVKELLREVVGEHTCDRRSSRTVIDDAFPEAEIEPGFSEKDELWQADHRETHAEHDTRTQQLLDEIFSHDEHTFISFTSHSGAIASLLRVIGHQQYPLPTGAMMPVIIKATKATSGQS